MIDLFDCSFHSRYPRSERSATCILQRISLFDEIAKESTRLLIRCRYQRLSPDCLPLGNGGSGAVPRKQASRSSIRDDDALAVATDGSRLASYLAASPHESKPLRARAPQPAPLSSATAGRSPAREHAHHHTSDSSDTASPSSTGGGGGAVVGDVLLQWGHNKRSRCRRDSATAAPSAQRRQSAVGGGGVKIQRRASAPAEKLMPPPPTAAGSYTRGSNLRSASSFPSRASASAYAYAAAAGSHHPPHHHHR